MSMFLGPIHYMMFNKIKIASGRQKAVAEAFTAAHGAEAETVVKEALPEGLVDFTGVELDDIVDTNNIHGFLQGLIDKMEVAEATLVTAVLYAFPDDSRELLGKAFREHGGKVAAEQGVSGQGLEDIANALSQFYLEGMPCDQVSSFSMNGDNTLRVNHTECLHRPKWEQAGAPEDIMCGLMDEWVNGFVHAANPAAKVERTSSVARGGEGCSCRISL